MLRSTSVLTTIAIVLLTVPTSTALAASPSPDPTVDGSAGTAAAAVRDDILPGVELLVEEVGPGAYRVLGDGVRDLSELQSYWLVAGRDGSIWLGDAEEPEGAFRIGAPGTIERPIWSGKLGVAPDGTIWIIERGPRNGQHRVSSFDAEAWQRHQLPRPLRRASGPIDLDVDADGTVWVVGGNRVGSLGPTGWQLLGGKVSTQGFVVTDAGVVWSPFYLRRHDDGAWTSLGTFDEQGYVGRGGTAWAQGGRNDDGAMEYLDRLEDGVRISCPVDGQPYGFVPLIDAVSVAADGSLWGLYGMAARTVGLARFDCSTWQYPLPDVEVGPGVQLAFADDGSVWVLAAPLADEDTSATTRLHRTETHRELYVVISQAVAHDGTEAAHRLQAVP